MKLFRSTLLMALAALAPLVASITGALAQDLKPVAVVSIASVEETLADVGYITSVAGMEDAGKTARLFGSALTSGMDKKRPAGLYVVPKDGDFHAIAFLPVSDLKQLLEIHKEYVGEPRDAGGGILEIGLDRSAFIKEQGGWAFVAESSEHLTGLPQDPLKLLGDLPKNYNIALRILVQNVPQELRQTFLDEIKFGLERTLDQQQGANVDREALERTAKSSLKSIEQYFTEAEEVLVGWAVDAAAKRTHIDVNVTAKEGTELAKQMAMNVDAKSAFTGVLLPDAAITLNASAKLSESDIAQAQTAFKTIRDQATAKIDDDPNLKPEQRGVAKEVVSKLFDVLEETAKTGKIDGGFALVLAPKSISMVGGGYVVDGPAFERSIKEIVNLGKNSPDFPKVQLNAGSHGGITLHKLSFAVPQEPEARELLGEKLDAVLGIGPKSVYFAAGKDAESLLKKVIDQSAQAGQKAVPAAQLNVSVLPILKFMASVDENPLLPGLIATLEKAGNDKLLITSQASARGSSMRIEIQ